MPRNDLDELLGLAGHDRRPGGETKVELCPPALRHLAVRHVAHQDVLEGVLVLAGNRGDGPLCDEVTACELTEARARIVRLRPVLAAQVRDRTGPEDGPDDGRVVGEPLLIVRQAVESRADEPLDARGNWELTGLLALPTF